MPKPFWLVLLCLVFVGISPLANAGLQAQGGGKPAAPAQKLTADIHKDSGLACTDCHEDTPKKAVSRDKCQQCHGSYAEIAKRTENLEPNPHYNHTIDLDCNNCHHQHKPMEIYCHNCHKNLVFTPNPAIPARPKKEGQ
jgi:fumarate reductase flavoprotein subunit